MCRAARVKSFFRDVMLLVSDNGAKFGFLGIGGLCIQLRCVAISSMVMIITLTIFFTQSNYRIYSSAAICKLTLPMSKVGCVVF